MIRERVLTRVLRGRADSLTEWPRQRHPLRQDVGTRAYHTLNERKGMNRQSLRYFDIGQQSIQILCLVSVDPSAFFYTPSTIL
jgi:hypothetical protein